MKGKAKGKKKLALIAKRAVAQALAAQVQGPTHTARPATTATPPADAPPTQAKRKKKGKKKKRASSE